MCELSKRRNQFRVEIRRQQWQSKFISIRKKVLESGCSEAFITQHLRLLSQNEPASVIIASMKQGLSDCEGSVLSILCEACAYILTEYQLTFCKCTSLPQLSQLLILVYSNVGPDVKRHIQWRPFEQIIVREIVHLWLQQRFLDERLFEVALQMQRFASNHSKVQYATFEQQIYNLMEDRVEGKSELASESWLKVVLIALKKTPCRLLTTKTKIWLYGLAKNIYQRQIKSCCNPKQLAVDFVIEALCVRGVTQQEQDFLFEVLSLSQTTQTTYRSVLRLMKLQTNDNYWITYDQIRCTLKASSQQLKTSNDAINFLTILNNLIVNQIHRSETIRSIYLQYFQGRLQVYLQNQAIIPVFSEIVSSFTQILSLEQEEELTECVLNLLKKYKAQLQKLKKRKLVCWLVGKSRLGQYEVANFLEADQTLALCKQLQNNFEQL